MSTTSDWLRCQPFNSKWFQLFKWQAPYFFNEKDNTKIASVQNAEDVENKYIYMKKREGKQHQQWDLIYQKDWVEEPGKGKMNRDFGLRVDTDFHIVSGLGRGRYIDYVTRNLVIKTQNGRASQKWYFHQPSRTIRGRSTNQSIDIHNSGKSNHL
jgi:hypothetical protein